MGNTPEKPSEIVTVEIKDKVPKEDPIAKLISNIDCDMPALNKFNLHTSSFEEISDYLTSIYKFKINELLRAQNKTLKKTEDTETLSRTVLEDNIERFALIASQLKKSQVREELGVIKQDLEQTRIDLNEIEAKIQELTNKIPDF
ncbi:hypothetical protein SteCoe_35178 [Stentor coeruleus]|uniref:Uncharacterized protein n=1 Tax=Stentor coeruleus TaxID=5963 RepID=A0A1R2AT09_9CILI|nr:hypothetical protein SteCoe_35178 [Stentor coeruleus]